MKTAFGKCWDICFSFVIMRPFFFFYEQLLFFLFYFLKWGWVGSRDYVVRNRLNTMESEHLLLAAILSLQFAKLLN